MALTKLEPTSVNTSATFTFQNANITANLNVQGTTNLGPVTNVVITGGSANYVLSTDGNGTLNWVAQTGGTGTGNRISNGSSNVEILTSGGNITAGVGGNANVLIITGNGITVASNVNAGNVITGSGNGGNITGANVVSANTFTANNLTVGTGSGGNITGANVITANTFTGTLANGNSTISIPAANGNINFNSGGTAQPELVITNTGVNVSGTANVTGNLSVGGNAVVSGNLTVDGDLIYINVTDLNVEDPIIQLQRGPNSAAPTSNTGKDVGVALNYFDTAARIAWMGWDVSNVEISFGSNVTITSEVVAFSNLANIRSGNAQLGNLATANFLSGVLTTAAQPNITSIGTLGSLSVTGNITGNIFFGTSHTASGPITGNANVSTVTGNMGIRAIAATYTDNSAAASGTIANAAIHSLATPTLAAANATVTATNAATFFIQGAPTAGTNMTIGNAYALFVNSGNSYLGGNVVTTGRLTPRVVTSGATSGNITPTSDTADQFNILNISGTANIQAPSGTPVDGQKLLLRMRDNNTPQTINWPAGSNSYRTVGTILPTTTVANKLIYVGCVYNSQDILWDVVAVGQET